MLKKTTTMLIVIITLIMGSIAVQAAASNIDTSQANSGIVNVSFKSATNATTAVRIAKGNQTKDHILKNEASFPLQFGEGQYTVTLLEDTGGGQFRAVEKQDFNFKLKSKNDIYLQSVQMINWNKDMQAMKTAKEITKNAKTDKEKVAALHEYIVNNITYDDNKAATVQPGYLSSIDSILQGGQGICTDYAALFAGMARSLNIPTKFVEGRKNDIADLHAWNQVYLSETNEWIIIDTTYDAALKKGNKTINMIKDGKEYKDTKEY